MAVGGPTVTLNFRGDADQLKREIRSIGIAVAGVAGTVGILGGIGAAASATVVAVAALPAAFLGIGIAAAAQSEQVKTAFTQMKDHVVAETQRLAKPIEAELLRTANSIEAAFNRIAPSLGRIFEMAAPHLRMFTDGVIALVENAMPGFETAIRNAGPLVDSFGRGLGTLGTGIGQFFAELTKGTPGAVAGMDALFKLTQELLQYLGQLVGQLANSLGPAFAALEPSIMQVVRALGDGLLRIVESLAPFIGRLGKDIADLLTAALDALLPIVEALVPILAEFAAVMMETLTPILRELGPVLAEVVKELADGLRPVVPVVAQAFRDMAPVIMEIARTAGPLLADIIRTLAPLFLELVKGALELTEALLPVVPPILELARNAMPVLAGVINDVVIPAIKFLVTEFVGLIDYGVKLAESFAQLSQRWRTYWEEIKAAFADANAKITAGIEAFARLPEIARQHWDAMYQAIKTKIGEIVTEVQAFPPKAIAAIGDMGSALLEKGKAFIQGFLDGAKAAFQAVLDWVANIPKMVLDAIGDTSKTLYNSGASLIDGFNKGMESKVADARAAGTVAVDAASNPFPQSPPKMGPFAGGGWTFFRGQSLIDGFIEGIKSMLPKIQAAATQIMSQAQGAMNQAAPMADAVKELLNHKGAIFEDLSFQGMSANLAKYNDQISDMFRAAGGKNINDLAAWASKTFGLTMAEDKSWVPNSFYAGGTTPVGSGKIELQVAPGADSALSSMLMNLVRTGQLQLQKAGIRI
jgi:phage-related protein